MPGINFTISAEDKNLRKTLKDIENGVNGTVQKIEESGISIEDMFNRIKGAAAGLGIALGAKELVSKIVDIRGEFQQLEIAFNTMLGPEAKANALLQQIIETSAKTPFGLQELANSAKQLMAYGVAAENVNDNLIMLGDIAAGLSIPLGDLAYLYGTTMTQGRMYTQDLNQFMGRGIPIADELAKQFGVTKDKVRELVTAGKVGFEEMHKALVALTSDGGKFAGLMNAQSQSITGRIETIKDSIEIMFNEIGKASEGIINTALDATSALVENYKKVGEVLMGVVSTYGVYKAAIMTSIAIEKVQNIVLGEAAVQMKLASMAGMQLTATQARGAAMAMLYSEAQKKVVTALRGFGKAMINPYTLAAVAIVGIVGGMYKLLTASTGAEKGLSKVNKELDKLKKHQKDIKDAFNEEISVIQSSTASESQKIEAYTRLQAIIPDLTRKYSLEKLELMGNAEATKALNQELENQEILLVKRQIRESKDRIRILKAEKESFRLTGNKAGYNSRVAQIKEEEAALAVLEKKEQNYRAARQKEQQKASVQNKKYWTDMKNTAEMALAEMGTDKKGTQEWINLEKQIKKAEAELAKYNITKKDADVKDANTLDSEQRERAEKIKEYKDAVTDARVQAEFEIRQAEINAMKDGNDKVMAQINLDYDKLLDENRKRKEDMVKELAEQKSLEWEMANPKLVEKGKTFDKTTVTEEDLTPEQKKILEFYDLLADKEKELAKTNATKELLSNYQTYMQKRTEVLEKYAKDEAAMKNKDGSFKQGFSSENVAILRQQREDALESVDTEFAMKEEQFESWANSVASFSLKKLEELLAQAESELEDMEYKIEEGESAGISDEDLMKARAAVAVYKDAVKKVKLNKGTIKSWEDLYQTLNDVAGKFDDIGDAIDGVVGNIISSAGQIISSTIQMIDGIRSLTDGSIDAIKGTSEAATRALQSVERASIILAIAGAALNVMTKISELSGGSHYERMKSEYEELISAWDKLIDRKLDYLNISYGLEAKRVEEETLEIIQKEIDAYKELAAARMQKRTSKTGNLGDRMMKLLSSEAKEELENTGYGYLLGVRKSSELLNLTSEQLIFLRDNATAFWSELDSEVREYLEKIIESYEKIAETEKKTKEQLTSTTFDEIYKSFEDMLSDMDADSQEFAENFEEYMFKAMLSSQIASKYKDRLQQWYDNFAKANEDGLDEDEIKSLKEDWKDIAQGALAMRDSISEVTGYGEKGVTDEQKATYGGFETMSEDTGSELNGRFTALQMAGEEIKNQMISSVVALNALVTSAGTGNSLLSDILTQHAITNAYLEDIVKYSKTAAGYGAKLDKIVEQTKNL